MAVCLLCIIVHTPSSEFLYREKPGRGKRGTERKATQQAEYQERYMLERVDMHNERFTAYYKAQNIISEDEWDAFMDSLRRPLPTTFRIAGSRQIAQTLGNTIKDTYIPLLHNVTFEDEVIPPPSQIPWYPDGLAWQFNVSKQVLRTSPEFKKFRSFLVHETEVGNISRQEAVSMLPPLLLDVQPHHKVMDMCAAPGSKTAQLLEALHANDTATATSTPPGLLIANDSDSRRAHLLIHQSARLPSPSFMVTNLDASIYPILRSMTPEKRRSVKNTPSQFLFDRILCDVPCSGDGTLRKNVGIWKRWQPLDGNGLHSLQVRTIGMFMNFSRDSFFLLTEFDLVDVSSQLPELIRRPGITNWSPTVGRSIDTSHPSWAAYIETVPEDNRAESKMLETHWPPSNADTLNLERCIRIYPYLQDTGGFFVAVLERKESHGLSRRKQEGKRAAEEADMTIPEGKKLKLETNVSPNEPGDAPSASTSSAELINAIDDAATIVEDAPATEQSHTAATAQTSKPRVADPSFKEMPYTLVSPDDPALVTCMQQLHLNSDFPTSNVLVRNPEGDAVRSLYIVNDFVKSVLAHNDYTRMRLMTAGTKVITKQEAGRGMDAHFRILGEGLPVVLPYIDPATIMMADLKALKVLLQTYYPLCISFQEPFRSAIDARDSGNHVVRFLASQSADTTLLRDLVLPLWKSNVSITLMVDKKVKSALSLRLFGEDVTIAAREASKKKLLAGTSAATQHDAAEPGSEHEDEDGEVEKDENDEMDIEEQEQ
ncbi:S-adenosyl-L-methionine-dependent methyltransferase [Boletus reticuloceps]|uniref:S-adenosyl-L-methionine-dependent methyltransferase n=1 Tax=Boletus reticuloceps TaxID=495285 RepID=A0A8I3ABZ0_9AGAM|nr:S-adenosyl-L-methionine-dependent methyltransferase [Boletus reticuloceps]